MGQQIILVSLSKGLPITEYVLRAGETLVGRVKECGLIIPHRTVSRRHAVISVTESVVVTDLGSCNGTFIDESPVASSIIRFGQILRFGAVGFRLSTKRESEDEFDWELSTYKSPHTQEALSAAETVEALSSAQKRVFDLLVKGLKENDVAEHLHLSYHTVHTHTREIYRLFGVHSRAELLSRLIPDS